MLEFYWTSISVSGDVITRCTTELTLTRAPPRLFNGLIALYIKQSGGSSSGPDSQSEQYKQLVIIAVCGIPGSLIATGLVELPYAGRKGSMALFTCLTGCFLFGFTTARTPNAVLGWNCGVSLAQNAMYGVSKESFFSLFGGTAHEFIHPLRFCMRQHTKSSLRRIGGRAMESAWRFSGSLELLLN